MIHSNILNHLTVCKQINNVELNYCNIAVIHIQLYTYTCGNIVNTTMTNEHGSLEKYISHFIRKGCERVMWRVRVSWRLNKDCNILTPRSSVFSSTPFSFCWAAQAGALRAQLSAGSGSHCLELQQLTLTPNPN